MRARWRAEPIGVGAASALGPHDRLIAPERYLAAHLARGEGESQGSLSAGPDLVPIAVGVALALSRGGERGVVLTLLDEAALAAERTKEAIGMATERRLPLVLVTDGRRSAAIGGPRALADTALAGQPLLGEAVDRDDPEAVLAAVGAAVERAREGRGTTLVSCLGIGEARGRRRRRHGSSSDHGIGDQDPIERYARRLLRYGMPRRRIEAVLRATEQEVMTWKR
jgi:TPP-dependent pyruvate/acetoin dehydrogenase alpha subunit